MLSVCFLPLVPECAVVQRTGSGCVSLNINSENYSCSFRGQCCCVNGCEIALKTDDKG